MIIPGADNHMLRIRAIELGIVLQKIILNFGG